MWEWIDLKGINTDVLAGIILAILLGLAGGIWKLIKNLMSRKKSVMNSVNASIVSNPMDYMSATYLIRIKEIEKIKVVHLVNMLKKVKCNAVLVTGSEQNKNGLLEFKVQIRPRSSIDHEEIYRILSFNQNGKYEVNGVFNIA
jgi:hypothetical protein